MKKAIRQLLLAACVVLGVSLAGTSIQADAKTSDGKTVIVLDPGHGGASDLGAIKGPFTERAMTLNLALCLQQYLQTFDNVEVLLTRTDDVDMTLAQRVDYAAANNADFFACLHFNASAIPNLHSGAEVYVTIDQSLFPQEAYFAQTELDELQALGLGVRGIKFRIGSHGDYYGILRRCSLAGIESALIEHCYLDADSDVAFLGGGSTEGQLSALAALAKADGDAIAKHLQLKSTATGVDYSNYVEPAITWPIEPFSDN